MSTRDTNIGASYNPWLIFEREEDAVECRESLEISRDSEWDDLFDLCEEED